MCLLVVTRATGTPRGACGGVRCWQGCLHFVTSIFLQDGFPLCGALEGRHGWGMLEIWVQARMVTSVDVATFLEASSLALCTSSPIVLGFSRKPSISISAVALLRSCHRFLVLLQGVVVVMIGNVSSFLLVLSGLLELVVWLEGFSVSLVVN